MAVERCLKMFKDVEVSEVMGVSPCAQIIQARPWLSIETNGGDPPF